MSSSMPAYSDKLTFRKRCQLVLHLFVDIGRRDTASLLDILPAFKVMKTRLVPSKQSRSEGLDEAQQEYPTLMALPDELLHAIAEHLDVGSVLALQTTCRRARRSLDDELVWRSQLHRLGFSKPARLADQTSKGHLRALRLHCMTCHLCRIDYDTWASTYQHKTQKCLTNEVVKSYSKCVSLPAAQLYDPKHLHGSAAEQIERYTPILGNGLHRAYSLVKSSNTDRDQVQKLADHPVLESFLLTVHPVFKLDMHFQRHVYSAGSSAQPAYPGPHDYLHPSRLQTETFTGFELRNSSAITVGDAMAKLADMLSRGMIQHGPTALQYFELEGGTSLTAVLGDYQRRLY